MLRTIGKVGGIDEYVCGWSAARVEELGRWGWGFRWLIMQRRGLLPEGAVRPRLLAEGVGRAGGGGLEVEGVVGEEGEVMRQDEEPLKEEVN